MGAFCTRPATIELQQQPQQPQQQQQSIATTVPIFLVPIDPVVDESVPQSPVQEADPVPDSSEKPPSEGPSDGPSEGPIPVYSPSLSPIPEPPFRTESNPIEHYKESIGQIEKH